MPVTVHLAGPLRSYAGGATTVVVDGTPATVGDALRDVGARFPGVRDRVLDEQGKVRVHVNVFVDKEDIRFLGGLDAKLRPESIVHVLNAVSGG